MHIVVRTLILKIMHFVCTVFKTLLLGVCGKRRDGTRIPRSACETTSLDCLWGQCCQLPSKTFGQFHQNVRSLATDFGRCFDILKLLQGNRTLSSTSEKVKFSLKKLEITQNISESVEDHSYENQLGFLSISSAEVFKNCAAPYIHKICSFRFVRRRFQRTWKGCPVPLMTPRTRAFRSLRNRFCGKNGCRRGGGGEWYLCRHGVFVLKP